MALIRDVKNEWSEAINLAADEVWQVRDGDIFLTTGATPESDDGLALTAGDGVKFSAGAQVRYRKSGEAAALIVREALQ